MKFEDKLKLILGVGLFLIPVVDKYPKIGWIWFVELAAIAVVFVQEDLKTKKIDKKIRESERTSTSNL